jgi:two-component system nitrate/nitrite response regulator NarL
VCRLPDLVLLDTRLPKMDGPTVARTLRMMASPPRILMLSGYGDAASVDAALDAGATGYVFKSVGGTDLLAAIERVLQGDQVLLGVEGSASEGSGVLSPQELIVPGYVAKGMPSKEIAQTVHVSHRTIDAYLTRIFKKLGAHNRTEAVARAARRAVRDGNRSDGQPLIARRDARRHAHYPRVAARPGRP